MQPNFDIWPLSSTTMSAQPQDLAPQGGKRGTTERRLVKARVRGKAPSLGSSNRLRRRMHRTHLQTAAL